MNNSQKKRSDGYFSKTNPITMDLSHRTKMSETEELSATSVLSIIMYFKESFPINHNSNYY